jgi:hypothetical protein
MPNNSGKPQENLKQPFKQNSRESVQMGLPGKLPEAQ